MYVNRFVEVELRVTHEQPTVENIEASMLDGIHHSTQERLFVVAYDSIEQIRVIQEVARGGYHELKVPIPPILTAVLLAGTDRFQLVHNHPSGDTSATMADVDLTHKVMFAANTVGLYFEDHLIVGPDAVTYSFVANGLLIPSPDTVAMAEGVGHRRVATKTR